jgi:hypothetical protein
MPLESISNAYSYENAGNSGSKRGFINISFKTKTDQIMFKEKQKSQGPILLNQVIQNKVAENCNSIIRCSSRLTHTNLQIQREIRRWFNENKIAAIKYRNCFFQIKKDPRSAFLPIPSMEVLANIMETNEQTTY